MAADMICGRCLTVGEPVAVRPRNRGDAGMGCLSAILFVVGLFVWPLLLLAGALLIAAFVIASKNQIAARSTEAWKCRSCQSLEMIPIGSPGGQLLLERAAGSGR